MSSAQPLPLSRQRGFVVLGLTLLLVTARSDLAVAFENSSLESDSTHSQGQQLSDMKCDGNYVHHLQGICSNDRDAVFWSFTTTLVKTDTHGKLVRKIPVPDHHGDLCCHDGKVYVAVNLGEFNNPEGKADSWVYVYDSDDLELLAKHEIQQVVHGAGGMAYKDGRFFVIGGLPEGVPHNFVYEYDADFDFKKRHIVESGHTHQGIQTATFADDKWYFGCYGEPRILLVADAEFKKVKRFEFDCSLGIEHLPNGQLLSAQGDCSAGCTGWAQLVEASSKKGLRRVKQLRE